MGTRSKERSLGEGTGTSGLGQAAAAGSGCVHEGWALGAGLTAEGRSRLGSSARGLGCTPDLPPQGVAQAPCVLRSHPMLPAQADVCTPRWDTRTARGLGVCFCF